MTRWEHIKDRGIGECARAISYCIARTFTSGKDIPCEEFVELVKSIEPDMLVWLSAEMDEED